MTGDNLPTEFYLFPDIFCIAVIMAKNEYCNQRPYRGTWHQLKCLLIERSPADRAVLLVFLISWVLYVAPIHPYYVWWSLWCGVILQFLFASSESLELFWRSRAMRNRVPIDHNVIPFKRRDADAVRKTPENSGAWLTAYGGGRGG